MSKTTENNKAIIAANILAIRQEKGMTQQAVAKELGISFQGFQKYESGKCRISAPVLWDLAKAFNTPIKRFFEGCQ